MVLGLFVRRSDALSEPERGEQRVRRAELAAGVGEEDEAELALERRVREHAPERAELLARELELLALTIDAAHEVEPLANLWLDRRRADASTERAVRAARRRRRRRRQRCRQQRRPRSARTARLPRAGRRSAVRGKNLGKKKAKMPLLRAAAPNPQ